MQNFTGSFRPELSGHDWLRDPARLLRRRTARRHQPAKSETLWRIEHFTPAKHLCRTVNMKKCHTLIWDSPPLSSDIYRIKWAKKSTNILRWKGGGNRWKQELFCIRSVFMLSLWHQEHLAVAYSAPRVVTSNGLLRASQGDYLCTISGSLWSLCDNSILS